jgi:ATP-binding protein involved in chromosome partitioning
MNEETIRDALKTVRYPGFSRDIVSFGLVRDIKIDGDAVTVRLALTTADAEVPAKLREACEAALKVVPGVAKASIEISVKPPLNAPAAPKLQEAREPAMTGVKAVVAVASGKGGVGKSTVSVNLACALASLLENSGGSAGILDCDIYGPSVPLMLGATNRPQVVDGKIQPEEARGLKIMSMGLLLDDDSPVVWRGPMVTSAINQFIRDVDWGALDILIVDLPPGTGDAQLALVQNIPVTGALIVTTPQTAAVNVAKRGARMFAKVNVPLLGVVENMSYFQMPDGSRNAIFGSGGGEKVAQALGTELLAEIPIDTALRTGCDTGMPSFLSNPQSDSSKQLLKLAIAILDKLNPRLI